MKCEMNRIVMDLMCTCTDTAVETERDCNYRWCRQTRSMQALGIPARCFRDLQNNPDPGTASRISFTPHRKRSSYSGDQRLT